MLLAALNAISYFVLSEGLTDLVGLKPPVEEAIGFPFSIWEEGAANGPNAINFWGSVDNVLIGLCVGSVFGVIGVLLRHQFNDWVIEFESENRNVKPIHNQFSLKSILFWTAVSGLFIALLTRWNGSSLGLAAIYLFGPATLIGIAMFPAELHWRTRAVIVSVLSIGLILIAVRSGLKLNMQVDRVMLGFFVCWTPQTVFAAFAIVVASVAKAVRLKIAPQLVTEKS